MAGQPIQSQKCPTCGKEINRVSAIKEPVIANPGDISICLYCATVNILDESMIQQTATENDLRKLDDETLQQIWDARQAIRFVRIRRN